MCVDSHFLEIYKNNFNVKLEIFGYKFDLKKNTHSNPLCLSSNFVWQPEMQQEPFTVELVLPEFVSCLLNFDVSWSTTGPRLDVFGKNTGSAWSTRFLVIGTIDVLAKCSEQIIEFVSRTKLESYALIFFSHLLAHSSSAGNLIEVHRKKIAKQYDKSPKKNYFKHSKLQKIIKKN